MNNEKWFIEAEPIKKFIVDGLNNPDKTKAFGFDAIEILAEIEYAPKADVVEVKHGRWIIGLDGSCMCSECGRVFRYEIGYYCAWCGAKLESEWDE